MKIKPFALERHFDKHEFSARYMLSASDCETVSLNDLLQLADSQALRIWQQLTLGYTQTKGLPLLREEVARLYSALNAENILVAVPEEAILLTMSALLEPGDHAIVTWPAYQSLYEIARAYGVRVTQWPVEPQDGGWSVDVGGLRDAMEEKTRLLVLNFPHNPTGFVPERAQWEEILGIAAEHGVTVFSDEMYWLLEHEPQRRLPSVSEYYERGISLFGVSKTFSVPGLRIGWLATRDDEMLARLAVMKDYTTICSSAPSEVLALIALRAGDVLVERNLGIILRNLALARRFASEHRDWFGWLEPQGGSVAFPRFLSEEYSAADFCGQLLREKDVLLLPGTVFEEPAHVRFGLGRLEFPAALERLGQFIREIA
jgi:aspartate/methionine/tyrosine aminotransferase